MTLKKLKYILCLSCLLFGAACATAQISSTIVVLSAPSQNAESIISNHPTDTVCSGENIMLSIVGGTLGTNAQWTWYDSTCGTGNVLSIGDSLTVFPTSTTTYYCTATGGCNPIACLQKTIYVNINSGCTPLPLHLLEFTATLYQIKMGLLQWSTANEDHTQRFDVEKSTNGILFNKIGNVAAVGQGGSNHYTFIDSSLAIGINYYRLKMVDNNSSYVYAPIRTINYNVQSVGDITLHPNPTNSALNFNFTSDKNMDVTIWVTDVLGRKIIASTVYKAVKGNNSFTIDVNMITSGAYMFNYQFTSNTPSQAIKFIKTN